MLLVLAATSSPLSASQAADWATYGRSAKRLNFNPQETTLSTATVPGLKLHWTAPLTYQAGTQPLFLAKVPMADGPHSEVFATGEEGQVLAVNAATGVADWSITTPTGTSSCGGLSVIGIYGTPTIDTVSRLMYVVDGAGSLHALDVRTGAEAAGYPVEVIDPPNLAGTYNHSSPTMLGNHLYITTSAPCEENKIPYHGQIVMFDTTAKAVVSRFLPISTGTQSGGGIWGPGGAAAETDGSFLYASTGNALPAPDTTPHAEQVLQLDSNMNLLQFDGPAFKRSGDFDFGSTPLLIDAPGAPPMLAAMNKTGLLLIYNRMAIGAGPVQTLTVSTGGGNSSFIGMPSYDPSLRMVFVNNPLASPDGTYTNGVVAFKVGTDGTLTPAWQQHLGNGMQSSATRSTAPVVANGVVWVALGVARELAALDAVTGAILWTSGTMITGTTISSPTVVNGQVFVQGGKALYAFGL